MTIPVHRLSDDHLDLIMTAALQWRVLPATHTIGSEIEQRLVDAMVNQVGQQVLAENLASITALIAQGRARLAGDAEPVASYSYSAVDQLVPVEVIKAVHAARDMCRHSPSWKGSPAHRWLDAVLVASTYRLDGFAAAPWRWTRPQRRAGHSIGVALRAEDQLDIPGLIWIEPDELASHWQQAPLIVIRVEAALTIPAELPARAGVFVLTHEGHHDAQQMWTALNSLDMEALSLFWPTCRPWLVEQIQGPAAEYCSYRSSS